MTRRIDAARAANDADHELTLVIPCFNECRRLPGTLARLTELLSDWGFDHRVLVVDDGSSDDTATAATGFGPRVSALRLPVNRGKGAAVRAGMLAATGRVVAFTDADLPYEPDSLRAAATLLSAASSPYDFVLGSRVLDQAVQRAPRPWLRNVASVVYREMVHRLVTRDVTDPQCGLKAFRRAAALQVFARTRIDGFAFDLEAIYVARQLGLASIEIPVSLVNEQESTVSLRRHGPGMLRDLLKLSYRRWRGRALDEVVPAAQVEVPSGVQHSGPAKERALA